MSSIRINLLPHREQKRQARQRQFYTLMISLVVLPVNGTRPERIS